MGQVVDTETAQEFMRETLERVDLAELAAICGDLEAKSRWFAEKLDREALPGLTEEDYHALLGRIFSTRGKTRKALAASGVEDARARIGELLYGTGELPARFQAFVDGLEGPPANLRMDLASELLHFTRPDEYWLWTRWMWDPRTRTGSLPLVTTAAYDLGGESAGEVYVKVGRAVAFVHEVGQAAGFQAIARSIFGTDVFLACVYVVYAYTVLRMRMTKEFNKVMPGLPEFCRRLLGVHTRSAPATR
jgi:hypothetical protein